jgi:serine/threonine protein kinase
VRKARGQVLEAVQYAHSNLVIHRDLKPGNVLVTADGQAMLLDFGIAKLLQDENVDAHETELTRLGGRALTLDYAAPEQLSGAPISTATDVYALGVLLYELLARQRPFRPTIRAELERAIAQSEPARPRLSRDGPIARLARGLASDLDTIVLKALKKAPAERYATINALAEDLERRRAERLARPR